MILTFLPALPVRDIRSYQLLQPFQKTKQQNQGALGHPRRYVEGATKIVVVYFRVILSNATSAEPSGSWCGKMGLAEQMSILHFVVAASCSYTSGWKGASLVWRIPMRNHLDPGWWPETLVPCEKGHSLRQSLSTHMRHMRREAGWSLQLPLIDLERPGQDPHRDGGKTDFSYGPPPAIPNEKQSYGICSTARPSEAGAVWPGAAAGLDSHPSNTGGPEDRHGLLKSYCTSTNDSISIPTCNRYCKMFFWCMRREGLFSLRIFQSVISRSISLSIKERGDDITLES